MESHTIRYRIFDRHQQSDTEHVREVEVQATVDELEALDRSGYLIRENFFVGSDLEALRQALDRLFEAEVDLEQRPTRERSWGAILRYLEEKDPVFLELIQHEGLLSIARAMMGPLVRLRGLSARISWPGDEIQSTPYHQHLLVNSIPRAPWFSDPHALDVLIYLDDLNDDTGTVHIVPESHRWQDREPPYGVFDRLDGEVALQLPAGSAVLMHGNLWHRAGPTLRARRRMLILGYTPCWLRRSPHGTRPENGLGAAALSEADDELRELLGISGRS